MAEMITDKFNSEIFGLRWGSIVNFAGDESLDSFLGNADSMYDILSVKIDTEERNVVNQLLEEGFRLMDTLIVFKKETNEIVYEGYKNNCYFRISREDDLQDVKRIAHTSFVLDQFHANPCLPDSLCDNYYERWTENLFNGLADVFFVVECQNEAIGYIALKKDEEGFLRVCLAAVDANYRNRGVFTHMIRNVLRYICENGYKGLLYGTQITNMAVLKCLTRLGFYLCGSKYVLHKVINRNIS